MCKVTRSLFCPPAPPLMFLKHEEPDLFCVWSTTGDDHGLRFAVRPVASTNATGCLRFLWQGDDGRGAT